MADGETISSSSNWFIELFHIGAEGREWAKEKHTSEYEQALKPFIEKAPERMSFLTRNSLIDIR
jgi:hypothetical protein